LTDETIDAAEIEDSPHLEYPGFLIPYFDHNGKRYHDYYRVRNLYPQTDDSPKYYQPPGTGVKLYIPPTMPRKALHDMTPIIFTEGEKKALKAVQEGFPTIGLGLVWNFANHTLVLSREMKRDLQLDPTQIQVPPEEYHRFQTTLALEFDNIELSGRKVYIIHDADPAQNIKGRRMVDHAALQLALELETLGADVVRVYLPEHDDKLGLDDFLVRYGRDALVELLALPTHRFPTVSSIKQWVTNNLDHPRPDSTRSRARGIAAAIVADLDARGVRFKDESDAYFYFDKTTLALHSFDISERNRDTLAKTTFGKVLVDRYGIDPADKGTMHRVLSRFASHDPITTVVCRKAFAAKDDSFYIQLSDTEMLRIDKDGVERRNNGEDDILFVAGAIEDPILFRDIEPFINQPVENRWMADLSDFAFDSFPGTDMEQTLAFLNTLMFVSPYMFRWRGTQLPNEIYLGEPGCGKSYLNHWRKLILCGSPDLQATPTSKKEWLTQIANTAGMWVYDNASIKAIPYDFVDLLRETICEINTQPSPVLDSRKLFTDNTRNIIPVQFPFAFTAINPLWKAYDFLQRSITMQMHPIPDGERDGQWYERRRPLRPAYIADHANALRDFLRLADRKWQPGYKAEHRLVNFEQSMCLMAEVLGQRRLVEPIFTHIVAQAKAAYTENSVEFMALTAFREAFPAEVIVAAGEILSWITYQEDFRKSTTFKTVGSFMMWLESNRDTLRKAYNVEVTRSSGNVMVKFL
jgi:hypothetical protein